MVLSLMYQDVFSLFHFFTSGFVKKGVTDKIIINSGYCF